MCSTSTSSIRSLNARSRTPSKSTGNAAKFSLSRDTWETDFVKIRILREQFDQANFRYTLIRRRGSIAVYRRKHLRFDHGGFEVVVIRVSKPHPKDPNYEGYDRVEIYPSDS